MATIEKNIDELVDYIIKTYKCVCAGPWEQYPEKLHAYTVAAAYAGLKSAVSIYESLGKSEAKIERVRDAIYRNDYDGIIYFINKLFVKDKILHKFRGEFARDVEEKPKVDAASYIVFALFDDGELFSEEIRSETLQELSNNHVFESIDGKSIYISKMPRRYEGDVYFGGGPWVLLGAAEAYYFAKKGDIDGAVAILDEIEKLIPANGFRLPEQEPIDPKFLSPKREGEHDAIGNVPAQDLMWSAAEYLRACALLLNMSKKYYTVRELARSDGKGQLNGLER